MAGVLLRIVNCHWRHGARPNSSSPLSHINRPFRRRRRRGRITAELPISHLYVRDALSEIGVQELTATEVRVCDRQKRTRLFSGNDALRRLHAAGAFRFERSPKIAVTVYICAV